MDGVRIRATAAKAWVLGAALVAALLLLAAPNALADTAAEINALPSLDALNRSEGSLANGGKWTKLSWASTTGSDTTAGWVPASGFPTVNGAYWTSPSIDDSSGEAVALTMAAVPGISERYVSVWLDMAAPASTKSGYQLRWTVDANSTTYTVKLSKWAAGTETVLASKSGVTIAAGSTLALVDGGSALTVWQGTGGALAQILSATDSTYSSGYGGIEGSGSNSRSTNFKLGALGAGGSGGPSGPTIDQQIIALPALDAWNRAEVPLSNGGKWLDLAWTPTTASYRRGQDTTAGWGAYDAFPNAIGAYWSPTVFEDKTGAAAALTMQSGPGISERYVSLWLEMENPASVKSGYQLRWTVEPSGSTYTVKLSKWAAGTETVLATKAAVSIPTGSTVALVDGGKELSVWQGTAAALSQILTASDSTYSSGYAGAEVAGNGSRSINFKAANLAPPGPTVITEAASAVKGTAATLGATVNPNGLATTYQFEYGTSLSYGSKAPATAKSAGAGTTPLAVSESITGLTPGTLYHFRIAATNSSGTSKGEDKTFTSVTAPSASTEAASEVSATEAQLNASVNPRGGATTYQFEYGPTTSYGTTVPASAKSAGAGTTPVSASEKATGLSEGNTYHYRVVASNESGTTYGADQTLTTPLMPEAATESGEAVNANEAILLGEVDPNGTETEYRFEYGPSQAYGSESAIGLEEAGDGQQPVVVGEPVAELKPSTTYHYRVTAVSAAGTDHGADKTFTTAASSISEAEEVKAEEDEDAGISSTGTPGDFPGMMWSGDLQKMSSEKMAIAVAQSGADWFRLGMHPSFPENQVEAIFREMAKRGITVLPYVGTFGAPAEVEPGTEKYLEDLIRKYGPHGTFWADKAKKAPAIWWEIGNEPNRGDTVDGGVPKPVEYGRFFAHMASAARGADASVRILFPGMFSASETKMSDCGVPSTCKMRIREFIDKAKQGIAAVQPSLPRSGDFDAVSVHPYVFKVNGTSIGQNDVKAVVKKLRGYVREGSLAAGGKPVWITEFGFPTPYDGTAAHLNAAPPVSEALQGDLIEAAFKKFKGVHDRFNVAHAFYYNIMDQSMPSKADRVWPWACGLRLASGKVKRPGWEAYARAAGGNPKWPAKTNVKKRPLTSLRPKRAGLAAGIVNDGSGDQAHFQYWKPGGANPPVTTTSDQPIEGSEVEQTLQQEVSGLQPSTTYMFHAVATNEEGDTAVGENDEFTTPPSTSTSTNVQPLNGEPGWVRVDGWVKEGFIQGPLPGLGNVHVHVRLYRNGQFQRFEDVLTNNEGHYDTGFVGVGKGDWEASSEFPGGGEWDASETTPRKTFTIKTGYQLENKNSGRCIEIASNSRANGAGVHQWECGDPATRQNQVFTLRPMGGADYELVARHSNRCIDVPSAVTYPGAGLQQYDCLGAGQPSQVWQGVPVETVNGKEYVHFIAKHSGLCLEVQNGGTGNGAVLVQNTCGSQASQKWTFRSVESNPVPTSTTATVISTVNGTPGQVTVAGGVNLAGYAQNKWVTVNYQKEINGQWVTIEGNTQHPVLDANGNYQVTQGVGVGHWQTRAIFQGEGPLEGSVSAYDDFTIQAGQCTTETFVTPSNPISSQPGFITISGHVLVPNPECGVVDNRWLNVNYYKENGSGQFVYNSTDHPVIHNGAYSEVNRPVGSGNWKVQAVFPAQDWLKESSSGMPGFTIGANGWHIDNLGGTFTADPDISSQGPGRLDVFGRGAENSLWIDSFPVNGTWGGWVPMGGALTSGPGAVSWSSGRIDVVMLVSGSSVSHWWWNGSSWSADNLGGTLTSDPDISSWGPNRLDVFARGVEGGLWHRWWGGGGWSNWEAMGGNLAGGPSAVSWGSNRIDVVARMTDNTIGHWYWGGGGWAYDNLGGTLTSDPDIASQGPGKLDVFARGTDNGLWHRWYTTSFGQWSNWEPMGGALTSGPGAVSWGPGRVDVVARGVNNSLEHWWYQN